MSGFSRSVRSAIVPLLVLLLPFVALTVRVESESKSEAAIDWRKVAALSALGAQAASGQAVAPDCQDTGEPARPSSSETREDWREPGSYPLVEKLILSSLGGHQHVKADIGEHLLDFARDFKQELGHISEQLCRNVKIMGLKRPGREEEQWWTRVIDPAEYIEPSSADYYGTRGARSRAETGDGSVLKRYRGSEPRGQEDIALLEKLLQNVKVRSDDGQQRQFFRLSARSASGDPSAELTVFYEPLSMSLRRYFDEHNVPLVQRLAMFFDIMVGVSDMYRKDLREHNSVVCPDNILVTAAADDMLVAKTTLCPSIFRTDVNACSMQDSFLQLLLGNAGDSGFSPPDVKIDFAELMRADIKQLGELLEWLVDTSPDGIEADKLPFRALATAMREGTFNHFDGGEGIAWEFTVVAVTRAMLISFDEALLHTMPEPPHQIGTSAFSDTVMSRMLFEHALENPTEPSSAFLHNLNKAVVAGMSQGHGRFGASVWIKGW